MNWDVWGPIIAGGVGSGIATYAALRVEIALLKQRQSQADQDRIEYRAQQAERLKALELEIKSAHDRIDKLQRSRADTIF